MYFLNSVGLNTCFTDLDEMGITGLDEMTSNKRLQWNCGHTEG